MKLIKEGDVARTTEVLLIVVMERFIVAMAGYLDVDVRIKFLRIGRNN